MAKMLGLSADEGYLPHFVLFTAVIATAAGLAAIYPHGNVIASRMYCRRPECECPLVGRIFGLFSVFMGIIRFYAAYDLHNPGLFALTLATYLLAITHFVTERFVYRTLYFWPALANSMVILTIGALWMLWESNSYVPDGFAFDMRSVSGTGYLPIFLLGTAAMAAVNGVVYIALSQRCFARKLYCRRPDLVNPITTRLFGIFCTLLAPVRIAAAYDLSCSALYQLAAWTYVLCGFHFATEVFVFRTIALPVVISGIFIIGVGLIWMTLQRDLYLDAA